MTISRVLLGVVLAWLLVVAQIIWAWPAIEGEIIFCDVDQGDGIIVQQGFSQIVIDVGKNNGMMKRCLERHVPWWDKKIELVVLTHPDADHIGSFPSIAEQYAISELMLLPLPKQSTDFDGLKKVLLKKIGRGITQITIPHQGDTRLFPLGMEIKIVMAGLNPELQKWGQKVPTITTEQQLWDTLEELKSTVRAESVESNNESIVLFLQLGEVSSLFTGDLEAEGEAALIKQGVLSQVKVLKVGHHGSKTSSTLAFIKKVRPEWSVISAGVKNSYGHPHLEVVQRLEESGSHLLRTDQLGTVRLHLEKGQLHWSFESR